MDELQKSDEFERYGSDHGDPSPEKGRWSQEQRLEFIDFRLGWEGRINRADLTRFFNISVPQASLDLARYRSVAPDNSRYDAGQKVYLKTEQYSPYFSTSGASNYLNDLWAIVSGFISREASFIGWLPPLGTVPTPGRAISSGTLYQVLLAIREKKKLKVEYLSYSKADSRIREISPHALGNDGFRWHTRAYCHFRNDFRDFAIARILNVIEVGKSDTDPEDDKEWNNFLSLELIPHPELPDLHKHSIEFDYSMTEGRLKLACREALLFYTLKKFGLDQERSQPSQVKHLLLSNPEEVENSRTKRPVLDGKQLSMWDTTIWSEE